MMKTTFLKSFLIAICSSFFLAGTCSNNDDNPNEPNNPDNNNVEASTDAPTDLFIVNMTYSGAGDSAGILGCHKIPISGDTFHRERLGLTDEVFFGVYGANYNTDGSFPTELSEYTSPYNENDRNKTSLTFILSDEATANAQLVVTKTIIEENFGTPGLSCGDTARNIIQLDFEIRPTDSNSNLLGGFDSVKYSDEDIPLSELSNLYIRADGALPPTTVFDFFDLLSENNAVIPIRIVETLIIENNVRTLLHPE